MIGSALLFRMFSCLTSSLLLSCTICFAQSPIYSQAVQAFNRAAYPQAANLFTEVLKTTPQDQLAHYYLGVCWHCMGRVPEASTEYKWVKANSTDQELIKRVDKGLQVLARAQQASAEAATQFSYSQTSGQPNSRQTADDPQASPALSASGQAAWPNAGGGMPALQTDSGISRAYYPGPSAPVMGDKPQIIDVYTSWCGWCKAFEPIFSQAQAKYGNQFYFQRLNAEVTVNKSLVKKYKVRGYPTILILDSRGGLVRKINGAPQTLAAFEMELQSAFPDLKAY